MMLISVIIPSYNAEKWIENAIKNIINQTYKNWELILIDDGSTDRTLEICRRFSNEDPRIKVYHQDNQGPSSARNLGLTKIKGDYFTIIDSDDYLISNALEKYLKAAVLNNADVVISGYRINNYLCKDIQEFVSKKDYCFEINKNINTKEVEKLIESGLMASNWNKLYRSSCLKNIMFDTTISLNEDVLFSLTALSKSNKVAVISDVLYEYIIQNPSSVSLKFHCEIPNALEALEKQLIKNQNENLRPNIIKWLMNYFHIHLKNICLNPLLDNKRISLLKSCADSYIFEKYGTVKNVNTANRKLAIILLRLKFYPLYIFLMRRRRN